MATKQQMIVEWFDELKGIGEARSASGDLVFLNANNIEPSNRLSTLKAGEKISCETAILNDQVSAIKITRELASRSTIEKSTFLDPSQLGESPEISV